MARNGRPPGTKGSQIERAMRFALWASAQPAPPTWQAIQGFLGCSRAAAHDWRRLWLGSLPTPHSRETPGGNRTHDQQESPR